VALLACGPATPAAAQPSDPHASLAAQLVAKCRDAVVMLEVTTQRPPRAGKGKAADAAAPSRQSTEMFDGTGFFITGDGYLVTNHHMIDRAVKISAELQDGRRLPGRVIASDRPADLALVKVDAPAPLAFLPLGDSDDLILGEPVVIFGDDDGFYRSVTTGVVSGLHRTLRDERPTPSTKDIIQLDVGANNGLSGAPFLNAYGQVIGIHHTGEDDLHKLNYAIPVNVLRQRIARFMDPGAINHVDVGVKFVEKLSVTRPATIISRISAADEPQRTVTAINRAAPRDIVDACHILLSVKAGDPVVLEFADGTSRTVQARAISPLKSDQDASPKGK
jgi:serine protease Do